MWWSGFATGAIVFGMAGLSIGGVMGFLTCREMQEEPEPAEDPDLRRERWHRGEAV